MAYGKRGSTTTAIQEVFSLNPLPYPVLMVLGVASVFLGMSWYLSYESVMESAEEQISWVLFFVPIALLLIARWLSTVEDPTSLFFPTTPWERRRRTHHVPAEGSSPWGVATLIVVLLVLVHYHSVFRDSWLI